MCLADCTNVHILDGVNDVTHMELYRLNKRPALSPASCKLITLSLVLLMLDTYDDIFIYKNAATFSDMFHFKKVNDVKSIDDKWSILN